MNTEVEMHVKEMLENKIIEPSNSPWASRVVLVKKKDGSTRFCVDYRRLNAITEKDAYPIPRIDETLNQLAGCKWFSTLDLHSGYWQIEMEPKEKPKQHSSLEMGYINLMSCLSGCVTPQQRSRC